MKIKFIDANCMIGKWLAPKLYFETAKQLVSELDYHSIEKALVFHSLAWQYDPDAGNRQLLEEIGNTKKLLPVFAVAPWNTSSEMLDGEAMGEIRGKAFAVRVFPRDQNFLFSKWMSPVLEFLEGIRIPVFINYDQADFRDLDEILASHPKLPVIISHTSYRISRLLFTLFEKYRNFYMEISSFMSYEGFEEVCKRFGAEKMVFGTRMPFADPGGMLARIIYADISDKEKQLIASGNIERLISEIKR